MRDLCFNCPYNKGFELGNGCGNDTCIQENILFEKDEEPVEISCRRAVMEEKERYEYFFGTNTIKDNKTNQFYGCAVDLLNRQDKRIKELEETLVKARQREIIIHQNYRQGYAKDYEEMNNLKEEIEGWREENQQLKQQLHDLPKKIVEEVEKNFTEYLPLKYKTGAGFYSRLNAILKKYGGEDE